MDSEERRKLLAVFCQGFQAYETLRKCPYKAFTEEERTWCDGWVFAEEMYGKDEQRKTI